MDIRLRWRHCGSAAPQTLPAEGRLAKDFARPPPDRTGPREEPPLALPSRSPLDLKVRVPPHTPGESSLST